MIPDIFEILKNVPALVTKIGSTVFNGATPFRLYPFGEAPQGVPYPYASYFIPNALPENYLNQAPDVDQSDTQIDVWAKSGKDAVEVAKLIRDELEKTCYMTSFGNIERDPDTKSYRVRMNFDIYSKR